MYTVGERNPWGLSDPIVLLLFVGVALLSIGIIIYDIVAGL
jgi:hypothetical protein